MREEMAELVTQICKECQKRGLTLNELREVVKAVEQFYHETATP